MKATRFGMKLPLDSFEIRLKDEGAPVLVRMPEHIRGEFYFHEYPQKEKGFLPLYVRKTRKLMICCGG